MKKNMICLVAVAVALVSVAACSTSPGVDQRFGVASMELKAQQTRDPAATIRNEGRPVDGLEGRAASNAVDQYYKSFTKEAKPMTVINFGLGSSTGN